MAVAEGATGEVARTVDVSGLALPAVRWGGGARPVLGVHGWGGNRDTFRPLARFLPPGASLWSIDLPGCGRAPAPAPWSLQTLTGPLATVIECIAERAGAPVTVVGSCSGANLGALAALGCQEAVERLVLVDPFAYMPWYFRIFVAGTFGRHAYRATFANPVGRLLTNAALAGRRTRESHLTRSFEGRDHEATLETLRLLGTLRVERFQGLSVPILIARGERTFGAVHRSVEIWRGVWPQLEDHVVPGAGHLALIERPEAVAELVFRLPRPVDEPADEPVDQTTRRGAAR